MKRIPRNTWSLMVIDAILFAQALFVSYVGFARTYDMNNRSHTAGLIFSGLLLAAWIFAIAIPITGLFSIFTKNSDPFVGCMYAIPLYVPAFMLNAGLITVFGQVNSYLHYVSPYLLPACLFIVIFRTVSDKGVAAGISPPPDREAGRGTEA